MPIVFTNTKFVVANTNNYITKERGIIYSILHLNKHAVQSDTSFCFSTLPPDGMVIENDEYKTN